MYIIWLNVSRSTCSWKISPSYSCGSGPDFVRPECLCPGHLLFSSHWCNRVDTISALSSSVQSLPAAGHWNRGVYELEAWNDASPVGMVYLQLEFICHQLKRGFCGKNFFVFLVKMNVLDGMEPAFFVFFLRHKHPVTELAIFCIFEEAISLPL